MIARIFATAVAALFGVYGFWSGAVGGGHILNPFGIMFLLLAALLWFAWGPIREAVKSVKEQSDPPIRHVASTIIKGMESMKHDRRERRRSPS
jgi:hypothetical protein